MDKIKQVKKLKKNNPTCKQCKHYHNFLKKEFPCIDCIMDCKDRFEQK